MQDDRLKSMEPEMIESILTEILQIPDKVSWSDIGRLHALLFFLFITLYLF